MQRFKILFADAEHAFGKFLFRHVNTKGRQRIWSKLSKLIGNGVPISRALATMCDRRRRNCGRGDAQVIALTKWQHGMDNGKRLSQVIGEWVSPVERMLIAAGDHSGSVEQSMKSAIHVMQASQKIRSSIVSGLWYPALLIVAAFVVLYMIGFMVVPAFSKAQPVGGFRGSAAVLVSLAYFAQHWMIPIAIALVLSIVVFFYSLPRWDGRVRVILDRFPPYSVYRMLVGSTWLISLAAMIEAGVRLENALQQLNEMSGRWMKNRTLAALSGMRAGYHLGDALLRSGFDFPDREIIDDLGIYSSLSGFDEALSTLGRDWVDEAVQSIESKMNVIFVVSIIFVAGVVGTMASGMIAMELQMVQSMQRTVR